MPAYNLGFVNGNPELRMNGGVVSFLRYYQSKDVCVCVGGVVFVWEGALSLCENKNWQYKILHNNSVTAMIPGPDKSKS